MSMCTEGRQLKERIGVLRCPEVLAKVGAVIPMLEESKE